MGAPNHLPPAKCPICHGGGNFEFKEDFEDAASREWSLYECHSCRVQFWMPLITPSGDTYEEISYDGKSEILNKESARTIVEDYWNARQFLRGFLAKDGHNKELLDVGCGTGEFMYVVRRLGYYTDGVDFNARAIAFARERLGLDGAVCADLYAFLKSKKERYDVITAFEVIEHIPAPGIFLEYARSALKKGGFLVVSTPNRQRYWGRIDWKMEPWDFPYQHLLRWDSQSLQNVIEGAGFCTIFLKKELPTGWFVSRMRALASRLLSEPPPDDQRSASERIRSGMGLSRYKQMKKVIIAMCTILAWPMSRVFRFEGVDLYGVFQKSQDG